MKTSRTNLHLTLGLAITAAGCGDRIGVIVLEGTSGTPCVAVKTEKIKVDIKKPADQHVGMAWVVYNSCPMNRRVKIVDIKQGGTSVVPPPLDCLPGLYVDVPKGQVRAISCVVKDGYQGKYTYGVKVGEQGVDPELIIKRR